jgi:hypothetical protein
MKAKPAIVVLLPPQRSDDRADLEAAGERLKELSASVVLHKASADTLPRAIAEARTATQQSGAVAALWVDEWHGERTLFVHVRSSGRTLSRRLPRGANPIAEREELASVARGTVSALLEGHAPSMEEVVDAEDDRAEASRAAPAKSEAKPARAESVKAEPARANTEPAERDEAPAPPRASGETRDSSLSASARAGYFGASPVLDSATALQNGVSLGLRVWFPFELYADASYAEISADTISFGGTSASIARHPGTLALGKAFAFGGLPTLFFSGELTLGVDRITRETLSTQENTQRTAASRRWLVSTGARAGVGYSVTSRVGVYALFGAELATSSFRYVSESADALEQREVSSVLTKLDVGGIFDLTGSAPFSN